MSILVTGGAGYIGSATVHDLAERGEAPVVIDNLVYGHRDAVPDGVPFYKGNIADKDLVSRMLTEHSIESCMHFSAYAYVGESVEQPQKYFENNVTQTLALLDTLARTSPRRFPMCSPRDRRGSIRHSSR
jgi:UDP-glucose 4-epimerase